MGTVDLFQGIDTFSLEAKSKVVVGEPTRHPTATQEALVRVCTSYEEIQQAVEVDASVAVSYGVFEVDAKSKYLHTMDVSTYSVTVILYASTSTQTDLGSVSLPSTIREGLGSEDAVLDFVRQYGDSYVSQLVEGSEYIGYITFKSRNEEEKTQVEAALHGKGVVGGVSVDTSLATKLTDLCNTSTVEFQIDNKVFGTTKAGPLPGKDPTDIPNMVAFAMAFPTVKADEPETISFQTRGYEDLLGTQVDFGGVTANRAAFNGTPAELGWGGKCTQLQLAFNAGNSLKDFYSFYGHTDTRFEEKLRDVQSGLDAVFRFIRDVSQDPLTPAQLMDPPALEYGVPTAQYKVDVGSPPGFLNGGGGAAFLDVSVDQISQMVRLVSLEVWHGDWIDQVVATYSTQYPPTTTSKTHGTPGGAALPVWTIAEGDFVAAMRGATAWTHANTYVLVQGLSITTRTGQKYSTADDDSSYNQEWPQGDAVGVNRLAPAGTVVGFAGRSGNSLDCIQPLVVTFTTVWKPHSLGGVGSA